MWQYGSQWCLDRNCFRGTGMDRTIGSKGENVGNHLHKFWGEGQQKKEYRLEGDMRSILRTQSQEPFLVLFGKYSRGDGNRQKESDDIEEGRDNFKSNKEMESHGETIVKWKLEKNGSDIVSSSGEKLERREKKASLPDEMSVLCEV